MFITVDTIGVVAKEPNELKEDAFGTPTRWLWVKFRSPTGSGILYLNVVVTGDTAVAAGKLAKGARVHVYGALGSRRFRQGETTQFKIVVEAAEVTAVPATEQAQATAGRKPKS